MMRPFMLALISLFAVAGGSFLKAGTPLEQAVFLPDVVHGTVAGVYTETTVMISNPGPAAAAVTIAYGFPDGPATDSLPRSITLKPGQTASMKVSGEPYASGYIKLVPDNPIAATAHVQTRPSEGSSTVLGEMAVLGQEPVSKCTIPVFVNDPIAENTGLVLLPYIGAHFRLSLYTPDGDLVGSKLLKATSYGPPPRVRLFITELFPDLPASFNSGCLVIEDTWPTVHAFVPLAVYTRGDSLRAGTVSVVDIPVEVIVWLATSGNVPQQASELAERYHFSVRKAESFASKHFLALMPLYTARVVAQDEKVSAIYPNNFLYPAL